MNIGGIAGTTAQSITLDAKFKLGEGRGCNTSGSLAFGSAGFLLVGLGLMGLRRRERV